VILAPVDAVLFDAGGTLVHLDYAAIARVARARGAEIGAASLHRAEIAARHAIDAHARSTGSLDGTDATRREGYFANLLRGAGIAAAQVSAILEDLDRANLEESLWRVPLEQAAETLQGLRERGIRTAVVSNADGRVKAMLDTLGLGAHLELVVDSHYEGVEKPDPRIFQRALSRLGVGADRAVYVGDIYSIDVLGARAAGLVPILIDSAGGYLDADCPRIQRLGELLDHFPRRA
jgi:putative hydrolase of the HAD superfamily